MNLIHYYHESSLIQRGAERSSIKLLLFGLGMLLPAIYFAWRYPLWPNTDRLFDIGQMHGYRPLEFWLFVVGIVAMYTFYILALQECRKVASDKAVRIVFVVSVMNSVVLAFMYPVNALDIFIYAVRSRLFTTYGVNPVDVAPVAFPGDPWTPFAFAWADDVSPYGPLWNLVAAPITLIAGDNLTVALFGFKALAVAAYLAGGWVLWCLLSRESPDAAASGTLFYLWNPLVLWEGVGNGHNDVLLALVLLLALLAWFRRAFLFVVPLLVVATLLKYVSLIIISLAAVALWKRAHAGPVRLQLLTWSVILSLITAVISFAPFYDIIAVHDSVRAQADLVVTSPLALAKNLPSLLAHVPAAVIVEWGKRVGETILLLALVVASVVLWRHPDRFPRVSFEALFIFLLVATWNFRPWYLIWPTAVAALWPFSWPAWRMIAWTAGGLVGYSAFIWLRHWFWVDEPMNILKAGVSIKFLPVIFVTLLEVTFVLKRRVER